MKQLIILLMAAVVLHGTFGCKKTTEKPVETESAAHYPAPTWAVDQSGKYPASMTAVVSLPARLMADQVKADRLAAFIGNECRGEGVAVEMDSLKVFFVLINGIASEQSLIKFRYYSTKTSFLYETTNEIQFKVDANYGTAEHPGKLELTALK